MVHISFSAGQAITSAALRNIPRSQRPVSHTYPGLNPGETETIIVSGPSRQYLTAVQEELVRAKRYLLEQALYTNYGNPYKSMAGYQEFKDIAQRAFDTTHRAAVEFMSRNVSP